MKITTNTTLHKNNHKVNFGAGVVNFISDYDGTYIPVSYPHDSIVKDKPVLDKHSFGDYFSKFAELLQKIRGNSDDPKLKFSISTGRNIHEFNYHVKQIKDKGLTIPLPDTLITCNGGDEYFRSAETEEFFNNSSDVAFSPKSVNKEKREWVKKTSGGWDGDEIRENLKKMISEVKIIPNSNSRDTLLRKITPKSVTNRNERIKWITDLFDKERTETELREHLENGAKSALDKLQGKQRDDLKWAIGELAHEITEINNGKYRFTILESKTNQCNWTYPGNISLQAELEKMDPIPTFYTSIRQDGNLNFHVAYPWVQSNKPELVNEQTELPRISVTNSKPGLLDKNRLGKGDIEITANNADREAFNINGDKTMAAHIRPKISEESCELLNGSGTLSKKQDVYLRLKEIIEKNLDDVVIVAGDGSNDLEMLLHQNYISFSKKNEAECIKQMKKLPLISIYVENKENKHFSPELHERRMNDDGVIRFIRVIPNNDTGRPRTLQEGILTALAEYSSENKNFADNLPQEIKEVLSKKDYRYPAAVVEQITADAKLRQDAKAEYEKSVQDEKAKDEKTQKKDVKAKNKKDNTSVSVQNDKPATVVEAAKKSDEKLTDSVKNKGAKNVKTFFQRNKKYILPLAFVGAALAVCYFAFKKQKDAVDKKPENQVSTYVPKTQTAKEHIDTTKIMSIDEFLSRCKQNVNK